MNAHEEVLARIAAAHRVAPPAGPSYESIERAYRTTSELDREAAVELLIDRLIDYKALVRRCFGVDLAATIAAALRERGAGTVVAPRGLDPDWLTGSTAEIRTDGESSADQLSVSELDAVDGVITGCAVAIAQTGTLVLDGSADQGRRVLTLIPDYHLCVVLTDQIVPDVPEGLARLSPTRPLTMISGPSATSDIELNRVEGVHGPRTLEVIIVGAASGSPTSSSAPLTVAVRPLQPAQLEGNERARSIPTEEGGGG
jgi:L-lactate dehydrogenase complex protein LldG